MSASRSNDVPPHDGQLEARRHELLERPLVPRVGAVGVEHGRRAIDQRGREDRLAARRAVERRDRHAPRALARDAPVRPVDDHVEDPVAAPRRDPLHLLIDRVARRIAQRAHRPVLAPDHRIAVHPDEPLRGRQENHRVVAAPAMRVLMRKDLAVPEARALLERLLHVGVRVEHPLSAEQLHRVEEMSARADRRVDLEAVLDAGQEVVGAVAGRGVHGARARVERHVVAEDAHRIALVQRMAEADALQLLALHPRHGRSKRTIDRLAHRSRPAPRRRSPRGRPRRRRRNRTPDETRSPGSTGSSRASSSR